MAITDHKVPGTAARLYAEYNVANMAVSMHLKCKYLPYVFAWEMTHTDKITGHMPEMISNQSGVPQEVIAAAFEHSLCQTAAYDTKVQVPLWALPSEVTILTRVDRVVGLMRTFDGKFPLEVRIPAQMRAAALYGVGHHKLQQLSDDLKFDIDLVTVLGVNPIHVPSLVTLIIDALVNKALAVSWLMASLEHLFAASTVFSKAVAPAVEPKSYLKQSNHNSMAGLSGGPAAKWPAALGGGNLMDYPTYPLAGMHESFLFGKKSGSVTGKISSSGPNIQQMPPAMSDLGAALKHSIEQVKKVTIKGHELAAVTKLIASNPVYSVSSKDLTDAVAYVNKAAKIKKENDLGGLKAQIESGFGLSAAQLQKLKEYAQSGSLEAQSILNEYLDAMLNPAKAKATYNIPQWPNLGQLPSTSVEEYAEKYVAQGISTGNLEKLIKDANGGSKVAEAILKHFLPLTLS